MKNKIIIIALSILLVASIGCNVYQFTRNKTISVEAVSLQTDIDSLNENISSLNNEKVAKGEEISALSEKVKDLEEKVSTLQSDNESLSVQLEKQLKLIEEAETPETPAVENTDNTSDFELSEEIIQSLRYLGASDEQIGAVKSESELKALVRQLTSFNGNSGSNSSSGSGSNSDSSGISGENEQDPSMIPQLDPSDAPAGSM